MLTSANLTRWIKDQQKSEGVPVGEDVYIILRLDGRVRRSGRVSEISEQTCFAFIPVHVELSFVISWLNVKKNYEQHYTRISLDWQNWILRIIKTISSFGMPFLL